MTEDMAKMKNTKELSSSEDCIAASMLVDILRIVKHELKTPTDSDKDLTQSTDMTYEDILNWATSLCMMATDIIETHRKVLNKVGCREERISILFPSSNNEVIMNALIGKVAGAFVTESAASVPHTKHMEHCGCLRTYIDCLRKYKRTIDILQRVYAISVAEALKEILREAAKETVT